MKKVLTNELMYDISENSLESIASSKGSDILDATTLESTENLNPWDKAHLKKREDDVEFVEPNLNNENVYIFETTTFPERHRLEGLEAIGDECKLNNDFEENWPFPNNNGEAIKSIW